MSNDMLLGSAMQLIKDIERISFLGERTECMKNYVAKHGGMKMKPYIIEISNVVAKS